MSGAASAVAAAAIASGSGVSQGRRRQLRWSLMFGNFVIGWVGALDRRKLLAASLAWYAIGHALCGLMPSYAALLPMRAVTVLGAAVFTPQAAAAIGAMTPPAERGGDVVGNALASRYVDRFGADRAVGFALVLMAVSLIAWPWATNGMVAATVLVPWALACFSTQSMQQARLGAAAPLRAPALMALDTSAIYLGQAAGASGGGWLIAHHGYGPLSTAGVAWLAAAIVLSAWASRARRAR